MKLRATLLACALLAGCAPSLPRPYQEARAAAERTYVAGRYDEAAQHWLDAARSAKTNRDRHEAMYRAAASYERAGRHDEADAIYKQIAGGSPHADRAARSAYELAVDEIRRGNADKGYAMLQAFIVKYPGSGVAKPALYRLLAWKDESGGPPAVLAYLRQELIPRLDKGELAEQVQFNVARTLQQAGSLADAKRQYLYVAARFPYPVGALWDDALWEVSMIDEQQGDYRGAIAVLQRMLAEQEPSSMTGTYQRPRYAPARFRIAVLYRDRLHDDAAARRAFHDVWTHHPTSLLRDDALWNEALLARKAGDESAVCHVLGELADGMPDSRYVPCAHELCTSMPAPGAGKACHAYILREARTALGEPATE